jgi:hypothetical protein
MLSITSRGAVSSSSGTSFGMIWVALLEYDAPQRLAVYPLAKL